MQALDVTIDRKWIPNGFSDVCPSSSLQENPVFRTNSSSSHSPRCASQTSSDQTSTAGSDGSNCSCAPAFVRDSQMSRNGQERSSSMRSRTDQCNFDHVQGECDVLTDKFNL